MKIRTLLIDSSYLLKRSFHGARDIQSTKYGHIGGLYQFLTTTRMLIKEHKINKVVLAWDGEGGGIYRYRIDRAYKANRKNKEWHKRIEMTAAEIRRENAKDESLLKQRKRIQEYAEELFFRQIEVDDIEADDLIAQYSYDHNNIEEIFIYSNDRDFAQLLHLNITIIFPNINQPVTKNNYMMHFEHHYSNALTMKIISGDVSDNIKGIPNIQEATLLKHFPDLKFKTLTVREICKRADEINKERVLMKKKPLKALENLISSEGVERLKINHQLTNLEKPLLNEEAIDELQQLEIPLSPENRGSKFLYKMMIDDDFLQVYGGTFIQYVEPFYTIIMNEKQLLKEYYRNNKNNI